MPRAIILAALLPLLLRTPVLADEASTVVEKAVQVHGGASRLARVRQAYREESGTVLAGERGQRFTGSIQFDLPQRYRHEMSLATGVRLIVIVNGTEGWQVTGGLSQAMTRQRLEELRDDLYANYVATLAPLVKESGFTLALLKEDEINGRKAVGVAVKAKDRPEVRLWFDRQTKLLVKLSWSIKSGETTLIKEQVYSEHKVFDGVQLPGRLVETFNGRRVAEVTLTWKFPERVDPKTFAKP